MYCVSQLLFNFSPSLTFLCLLFYFSLQFSFHSLFVVFSFLLFCPSHFKYYISLYPSTIDLSFFSLISFFFSVFHTRFSCQSDINVVNVLRVPLKNIYQLLSDWLPFLIVSYLSANWLNFNPQRPFILTIVYFGFFFIFTPVDISQ